jgi:hypothetical protein
MIKNDIEINPNNYTFKEVDMYWKIKDYETLIKFDCKIIPLDPIAFRLACKKMQTARSSASLWLNKTREFEEEIRGEKAFLSQRYKQRALAKPELLWHFDWSIELSNKRLLVLGIQLRKFSFYHSLSLGRPMPESFDLEALKTISPEVLLGEPVMESGKLMTFKCPYHNEKHASFTWYKKENHGHCFGCSMNSDIVDLYKHLNNCDFKTACTQLKHLI